MCQKGNSAEDLNRLYKSISIPDNLDEVILSAVKKGKDYRIKNQKNKRNYRLLAASTAAVLIISLGSLAMPSLANSVIDFPILGKLVRMLILDKNNGVGGERTDGTDVKFIKLVKDKKMESIVVDFTKDEIATDIANSFKIDYFEYPSTMVISIPGARRMSAIEDFQSVKENSNLIKDIFPLVTLDDSMVRFAIVFDRKVQSEIREFKEPAQLIISISEDMNKQISSIYSIRTASYPRGEELASMEEALYEIKGVRVLKDEKGTFSIEAGYYSTEREAKDAMEKLNAKYKNSIKFFIEERTDCEIPKMIDKNET
jgi:hypothetical protein